MTVRNLEVRTVHDYGDPSTNPLELSCQMFNHSTGEWHVQNLSVTAGDAFTRLSNWNAVYDSEAQRQSNWEMKQDILSHRARYGCGF